MRRHSLTPAVRSSGRSQRGLAFRPRHGFEFGLEVLVRGLEAVSKQG